MNRSKLKAYAPQARRDFIQAVMDRAALYGLTKDRIEPITEQGDVAIIAGKAFPRSVAEKRRRLEERIERHGFEQVMEAIAYTWFNRFVAIRYMELHGYLDHGYRVLSHPDLAKTTPEILEHAEHVTLPGLDNKKVIDLKLDGTKESELYRMLLIAQCNALHKAMSFLFERIDDETELLLPNNLLHSDSLIRKLAAGIEEEDWQQVEIIGWLYQFYISEKKAEVIGKVVKSKDIPAATQLFTPNWIVKYLVQNSLGRQWLATYPDSPLRQRMEYYIEPAEQTPEVQAQLKAITPESLNPEELTLMDPACGSGHILVEGYDLLKEIYLERGYRLRDIPKLILTKNLFGLEIDDRAAQLAAFALMMKARADDRRIFDDDIQPNVLAIQESNGLNVNAVVQAFTERRLTKEDDLVAGEFGFMAAVKAPLFATENRATATKDEKLAADVRALLALFQNAKTYGSLNTIPPKLAGRLPALAQAVEAAKADPNFVVQQAARIAGGFVATAMLLAKQYDAVAANPPYMGAGYFNAGLAEFVESSYRGFEGDLYAAFYCRATRLLNTDGRAALITIPTWLFLPTFEAMRRDVLGSCTCQNVLDNGRGIWGSDFGSCAFIVSRRHTAGFRGHFLGLSMGKGSVSSIEELQGRFHSARRLVRTAGDFLAVPGCPISCYAPDSLLALFGQCASLEHHADVRQGLKTGDIARFMRFWHEVSQSQIFFDCASSEISARDPRRWYPCNKGGEFRKWFGNLELVLDWQRDGAAIKNFKDANGRLKSRPQNLQYFFRPGITWSTVTMAKASFRVSPAGRVFESGGSTIFPKRPEDLHYLMAFLNSSLAMALVELLSPKVSLGEGAVSKLPVPLVDDDVRASLVAAVHRLVSLHEADWMRNEEGFGFQVSPLMKIQTRQRHPELRTTTEALESELKLAIDEAAAMETAINRGWLAALDLDDFVPSEASREDVTLDRWDQSTELRRLASYCVGCTMGRYSLDKPGLIYANSGNAGFDSSQYKTFPADPDGIIPVTEFDWFPDSAARRLEEFVGVAWPKEHLEENLKFVANSLGPKNGEQPRDTIRRYFADDFYKDHLKTYKRRPIYWLFTSGKLGAFQCLIYLHRYNEGTLARMRTEYVIPLQGKISQRIEQLTDDITAATSTAHRRRLVKEHELLKKHRAELLKFDEKLRHYADLRIKLDLDDGVKVNYGKFGDLLAEVKAVCGKREDDE